MYSTLQLAKVSEIVRLKEMGFSLEKSGYTIAGQPRESYIDGCWNKESETDWLTEIQISVRVM